jgi:hopanoid C-3 methylase
MYASFMVDPAYSRDDFRSLISFVRRLKLKYATFTVMTPLPGTKLHAERRQEILSQKPELYDMLHALLPTSLPLEEFYRELGDLYAKAVPLHRVLPALLRFGLHGMVLRIRLFGRLLAKIRTGYLDY